MITTAQIKTVLDTDSIIREHRQNCVFWFNQDKTYFVAYGPRWGWCIHHGGPFSGKGETFDEALAVLDLEKLWFDVRLNSIKR